jgi:tetratricopeptide (TPR) repeat protein
MRAVRVVAILGIVLIPSVAVACLWDYDTIKMERTRFPNTLELITGKFLRHSPEFYEWRIENRLKRLQADPTDVRLLDDLAVAYDKTGQHDKAIEIAIKTEKLNPGRYETAANLGTFYFHAGKLKEGLPHIERALEINPDAHFGREVYQKLLAEYVLEKRVDDKLALPMTPAEILHRTSGFAGFIKARLRGEERNVSFLRPAALKGILGMMRFGNHASPVLLEALGNVLTDQLSYDDKDAKLLAARAYLKASYEVTDEDARAEYRKLAGEALQMQTARRDQMKQITLEQVEADFETELEEARTWYADLRERELSWIRDGLDPEAEFDKLYDAEPEVSGLEENNAQVAGIWDRLYKLGTAGAMIVGPVLAVIFVYLISRKFGRAAAG